MIADRGRRCRPRSLSSLQRDPPESLREAAVRLPQSPSPGFGVVAVLFGSTGGFVYSGSILPVSTFR